MKPDQDFLVPKAFTSSLQLISTNYALRCDAKYADPDVISIEKKVREAGFFVLSSYLPLPFVKGVQPNYLDQLTEDSVPVINTLSIQNFTVRIDHCRHIAREDYDALSPERQLRRGDVLLTVDGGVSIGKPVLFDLDRESTIDSHVVILRPEDLSAMALVYLLASPLGQVQFRRAESGASGQTTVTEDDIRRFIFPCSILKSVDDVVAKIESERRRIANQRRKLDEKEANLWKQLDIISI